MFQELVSMVQDNVALTRRLKDSDRAISGAKDYLGRPGCNLALGQAHLARSRARHSAALTLLRANRVKAREAVA